MELMLANRTDTYVIDKIQIVSPDDVSVLQATSTPSLTLVTCYPFYFIGSAPQRYIVHDLDHRLDLHIAQLPEIEVPSSLTFSPAKKNVAGRLHKALADNHSFRPILEATLARVGFEYGIQRLFDL